MSTASLQILLLDDESMLLDLLEMMLSPHHTHPASSLDKACQMVQERTFDVFLCDLMMPGGGGLDLYDWLQANQPHLTERMIFLTGGIGADVEHRLSATQQPVLYKPFSIKQLHDSIDSLLKRV